MLCLVDDLQWLDQPSRGRAPVRGPAPRRRGRGRAAGACVGDDGPDVDTRGLPEIALHALDPDAAAALVARAAHGDLAPSVRDLVVHEADGNPLALLELSVGLSRRQLAGTDPLPETLPLAHDVERLFLERVRRLPAPTQLMLLLIAARRCGRLAPVMGAAGILGVAADALTPAEDAGLVEVRGTSVEVRHPLVRSAIYQAASSHDRRCAHLALADAMPGEQDADRRAWHHALAAVGPDAGIADELERTAERARQRSGHAAAATALQRAAELSVDDASRGRRLVAAARAAWQAGHSRRAARLAQQAIPLADDPRLRAELLHVQGEIGYRCGGVRDAAATLLGGADEIAPQDPRKALDMILDGCLAATDCGEYDRVVRAGDAALQLPLDGDPDGRFLAALIHGVGALLDARPKAVERAARGARRRRRPDGAAPPAVGRGRRGPGGRARARGRAPAACRRRGLARAARSTRSPSCSRASRWAAWSPDATTRRRTPPRGCRWRRRRALQLRDAAPGVPRVVRRHPWRRRAVPCARGRGAGCGPPGVRGPGQRHRRLEPRAARPRARTSRRGRHAARRARRRARGVGHRFIVLHAMSDLVEAAVRCDLRAVAEDALPTLERRAGPQAPAWLRALAARCRGLLADGDEAERELREAVRLLTGAARPFDLARSELLSASTCAAPASGSRRASTCARLWRASTRSARRPGASARASSCAPPARPPASATRARSSADPTGTAGRALRRGGPLEPRDRDAALPLAAHHRRPPPRRLREARADLAPSARADPAGRRAARGRGGGLDD